MATFGAESIDVSLPSPTIVGIDGIDITTGPENSGSNDQVIFETITTSSGSKVVVAFYKGASTVLGSAGSDSLNTGSTDEGFFETIITSTGSTELVFVYKGGSTVIGSSGTDSLSNGSAGAADWSGESTGDGYWSGKDSRDKSNDKDRIKGSKDSEKLRGTNRHDHIVGGKGSERIIGGNGDDLMLGKSGDDVIKGGRGDDVIVGGTGVNKAKGNSGKDTFVLSEDEGYTKILDFNTAEDKIQIASGPEGVQLEIVGGNIEINQNNDLLGVVKNQSLIDEILVGITFG